VSQYGDDDGESVVRHDVDTRVARKAHVCSACRGPIRVGDLYTREAMLWGGSWEVVKRCPRCQAIFAHLSARIRAEGDRQEHCDPRLNCGHEYKEKWDTEPPPHIAALAFWLPGDPVPT
jgi:hypothetical protein